MLSRMPRPTDLSIYKTATRSEKDFIKIGFAKLQGRLDPLSDWLGLGLKLEKFIRGKKFNYTHKKKANDQTNVFYSALVSKENALLLQWQVFFTLEVDHLCDKAKIMWVKSTTGGLEVDSVCYESTGGWFDSKLEPPLQLFWRCNIL